MKRILLAGCGDIALRVAALLRKGSGETVGRPSASTSRGANGRCVMYGLVRNPARAQALRASGIIPVSGDLDEPESLSRIAGLADTVLHFAPPQQSGTRDLRTRHLLAALSPGKLPAQLVYISTSGVYGDCGEAWVSETRTPHPQTARAQLRADAERQLRAWGRRNGVRVSILRVPGIYALGRLPLERLRAATPSVVSEDDGYTNHIHADDLARTVLAALRYGKPNRVYNTSNDSPMKTGDYFDAVADACKLPRPPRLLREQVRQAVSAGAWSFMAESKRLRNERLKKELRVRLRYPVIGEEVTAA